MPKRTRPVPQTSSAQGRWELMLLLWRHNAQPRGARANRAPVSRQAQQLWATCHSEDRGRSEQCSGGCEGPENR